MIPRQVETMKRSGSQPVARRTSSGRIHSPTRERILELVGNADQGLALSAIAATTGLHENTVRAHLEALLEDGYLLRKAAEATGRGRPAWIWFPAETQESTYAALASVLAEQLVHSADDPRAASIAAGRRWGQSLGTGPEATHLPAQPAETLVLNSLEAMGFAPAVSEDHSITLNACPLIGAAEKNPGIVCNVHLGMVRGLLESAGTSSEGTELKPFASKHTCQLELPLSSQGQQ